MATTNDETKPARKTKPLRPCACGPVTGCTKTTNNRFAQGRGGQPDTLQADGAENRECSSFVVDAVGDTSAQILWYNDDACMIAIAPHAITDRKAFDARPHGNDATDIAISKRNRLIEL